MTDHFVFARIIERFLPALRQRQQISPDQAATCQNILNCHTPVLGGLDYACHDCGSHYPRYHSCRHRHCPQCQPSASARWVAQREQDLLPLPYYHLVFTLPHALNGCPMSSRGDLPAAVSLCLAKSGYVQSMQPATRGQARHDGGAAHLGAKPQPAHSPALPDSRRGDRCAG